MTSDTTTPAQAARAGARGGAPASPPIEKLNAARRAAAGVFKPRIHCGSKTHQTAGPCMQRKGFRTDHPGVGRCWLHGGRTPSGRAAARREKVSVSLKALAVPVEGDPLEALQAAVERAHGAMLGAQALLAKGGTVDEADLYLRTIRDAARVAKAAAEAINLDELVRIREREADLLETALMRTLDRFGIGERRRPGFLELFREELRATLPVAEELS